METVSYIHLKADGVLPTLSLPPFKVVVVIEQDSSEEQRDRIASWLLNSGCLYFLAWGQDCEAWHDSADHANNLEFNFETIPDSRFVMTTWHEHEPLSEAFWFAAECAEHPTVDLAHTLILHVALRERGGQLISEYNSASNP